MKKVKTRRRIAYILFFIQLMSLGGGKIDVGDSNPIAYYLGYFSFSIIAIYFLLSAKKMESMIQPELYPEESKSDDLYNEFDDYDF